MTLPIRLNGENITASWFNAIRDEIGSTAASQPITLVTEDYTILPGDRVIFADCTLNIISILLPSIVGNDGATYWIKKIDDSAFDLTINTDGVETIDGESSVDFPKQYQSIQIVANGSEWSIFGNSGSGAAPVISAVNPTSNDDIQLYELGQGWINTILDTTFTLVDNTLGAAIWNQNISEASADAAAISAAAALVSENAAALSETNSAASESASALSASNALTSEGNASASESNALAYQNAAAISAADALLSENASALSETNSGVSETNSAASESAANLSAVAAAASESVVAANAAAALASENAAALSEANSSASESASALSEVNSGLSETASALSETNSGLSEAAAQLAETNAETAETNSAASAAAALVSQNAALASEIAALASSIDATGAPSGTISPWIGGYFTGASNSGFTNVHGNTIANANAFLNPYGWYVCDGTELDLSAGGVSIIFDGAGRYLPDLTDDRFIQGHTEVGGTDDKGGSSSMSHTHTVVTSCSSSGIGDHVHTVYGHSHSHNLQVGHLTSALDQNGGSYRSYATWDNNQGTYYRPVSGSIGSGSNNDGNVNSSYAGGWTPSISNPQVTTNGISQTENRPKYLSLFYIMKATP